MWDYRILRKLYEQEVSYEMVRAYYYKSEYDKGNTNPHSIDSAFLFANSEIELKELVKRQRLALNKPVLHIVNNEIHELADGTLYAVYSSNHHFLIFNNIEDAYKKYEELKDRLLEDNVDENSFVELVKTENDIETETTIIKAIITEDIEQLEEMGSPADNGMEFDWWAKWIDVDADGSEIKICDGKIEESVKNYIQGIKDTLNKLQNKR